jgi:hypothetical protein
MNIETISKNSDRSHLYADNRQHCTSPVKVENRSKERWSMLVQPLEFTSISWDRERAILTRFFGSKFTQKDVASRFSSLKCRIRGREILISLGGFSSEIKSWQVTDFSHAFVFEKPGWISYNHLRSKITSSREKS